jgi:hypothetical protein
MTFDQARKQLRDFTRGEILSFSVTYFENGEWSAVCNEIPAITTGGINDSRDVMEELMRDAILTAAGVDGRFADELLPDASLLKTQFTLA